MENFFMEMVFIIIRKYLMDADEILLKKRLMELAQRSYNNGQYLFTGFLSEAQQDCYYQIEREISHVPATFLAEQQTASG